MHSHLQAARFSLRDCYPEDALPSLLIALGYCPKGSREWSLVMTAIKFTRKAIKGVSHG